jgi:AraC family L-rhamnose operon regulatory protein RhaS
VLCLSERLIEWEEQPLPDTILECRARGTVSRILAETRELAAVSTPGKEAALLKKGLACSIVGRVLSNSFQPENPDPASDSKKRVLDFLKSLKTDYFRPHRIDDAARTLGLSRRRFTQLFRELSGSGFHEKLRKIRIARACELLKTKDISPLSVAFECGYEDVSTFYRAFKAETGRSPLQFQPKKELRR